MTGTSTFSKGMRRVTRSVKKAVTRAIVIFAQSRYRGEKTKNDWTMMKKAIKMVIKSMDLFSEPVIDILNRKAITREITKAEVSQILASRMKK